MYAVKSCYLKANHTISLPGRIAVKWSPSQDGITGLPLWQLVLLTTVDCKLCSLDWIWPLFVHPVFTFLNIWKEAKKKKIFFSHHMKTNWYLYLSLNKVLLKRPPFSSMCLLSVHTIAWPWQSWTVLTGKIQSVKLKIFAKCPFK